MMGPELVLFAAIIAVEPSVQAPITRDALERMRVAPLLEEQLARHISAEERARIERASLWLLPIVEKRVTVRFTF
jgi:hypothetical protein